MSTLLVNLPKSTKMIQKFRRVISIGNGPYWRRAWGVQEQRLARTVVLLLGHSTWDLSSFRHMLSSCVDFLQSIHIPHGLFWTHDVADIIIGDLDRLEIHPFLPSITEQPGTPSASHQRSPTTSFLASERYPPTDLTSLVKRHRNLDCSTLHDRLYSLRSLATDGPNLPVNYNVSIENLLIHALLPAVAHFAFVLSQIYWIHSDIGIYAETQFPIRWDVCE